VITSCTHCSEKLEPYWSYCPHCGAVISDPNSAAVKFVKEKKESEAPIEDWWNTWPELDDAQNPKPVPEAAIEPRQPPDELGLASHPARAPPRKNISDGGLTDGPPSLSCYP
jgi:hypothetical protein